MQTFEQFLQQFITSPEPADREGEKETPEREDFTLPTETPVSNESLEVAVKVYYSGFQVFLLKTTMGGVFFVLKGPQKGFVTGNLSNFSEHPALNRKIMATIRVTPSGT